MAGHESAQRTLTPGDGVDAGERWVAVATARRRPPWVLVAGERPVRIHCGVRRTGYVLGGRSVSPGKGGWDGCV